MKNLFPFILLMILSQTIKAQYELDPEILILPDASIDVEATSIPVPALKEDVKAVGMGKTGIATGRTFNGMMYNPALLSRDRFMIDALNVNISLPPESYDAANYLYNHYDEFEEAVSLKGLWAGIRNFRSAVNFDQQLAALKAMQESLRFPRELFQKVIGTPENPVSHGIRTIPSVSVQVGNFGFTLYGVGQSAFEVEQNPIMDALLDVPLPDDLNDPQQVADAVLALEGLLMPVLAMNNFEEALPYAYSVSYVDIVGAAGYSYTIAPDLNIGANLKVIHRRFSARKILLEEYKSILNILKRDLDRSVTGVTLDIGGLHRFSSGTEVGMSIQNIIPVQEITSTLRTDVAVSYLDYKRDAFGNIQLTQSGDTLIQSVSQTVDVGIPFDLELPMIINAGAVHPITENWDVALDWVDITDQDIRFEDYGEHFRIGTEYRLDAVKEKLGIAFRIGMADTRFTGGIGLNLYRAVQLDGAYAWDNFVGDYSYFAQVRIGW